VVDLVGRLHQAHVFDRRVRVLAGRLAPLYPERARVLDVGCGDGRIAHEIGRIRPDLSVQGIDVLLRPRTYIPVSRFDGSHLPFADGAFDAVSFVDVLHHTLDPNVLLAEASRVARHAVIIKDHCADGLLAHQTLRLMDWVGNARHGVALPYNYWTERQWREAFARLALTIEVWQERLGLYPWPASLLFDRRLHFVARLGRGAKGVPK